MFLLIREKSTEQITVAVNFTFHNVSINTDFIAFVGMEQDMLYIPQCFY